MAEASAVASIVGIASFGIQLTQTLYTFGCNVASAREETNYIARHVDLYSNVLDILTERLDDEEPILSDAAFDMIDELQYQSEELFTKIEQLLPSPKDGKDDISFLQKVKWNFTKSRVALLVGELDYLRSTVHLLVTIIFTGRKIRSRRRRKAKHDTEDTADLDNELGKQGIKAQNALLAQQSAEAKLPELEQELSRHQSIDGTDGIQAYTQRLDIQTNVSRANAAALDNLQQSLAQYTDPAERQRLVLQHSAHVLHRLLQQWTTVDLPRPDGSSDDGHAPPREQPQPAPGRSPTQEDNGTSTEIPLRHKHDLSQTLDTGARTPQGVKVSPTVHSTPETKNISVEEWRDRSSWDNIFQPSISKGSPPAQPGAGEALPPGWSKAQDKNSGRPYYYDSKSLKSQWESPARIGSGDALAFQHQRTPYASARVVQDSNQLHSTMSNSIPGDSTSRRAKGSSNTTRDAYRFDPSRYVPTGHPMNEDVTSAVEDVHGAGAFTPEMLNHLTSQITAEVLTQLQD